MGNIIRLSNGGQIQVRTGVLQGIGPAGPRGPIGPAGRDGAQGPQGLTGDIGQILQVQARASISAPTTVLPDTDTVVAFASVAYDDLACAQSATVFQFADVGDYQMAMWVQFGMPGNTPDGFRSIGIWSETNGLIAKTVVPCVLDEVTCVQITHPFRTTVPNEKFSIRARSGDDTQLNISGGALTITRIGSGPRGFAGPVGPAGGQGPVGPQGPAGPAGNSSSGYASYNDLL